MEANGVNLTDHLREIVDEIADKAIDHHGHDECTVRIAVVKLMRGKSSAAEFLGGLDAQPDPGSDAAFELLVDAVAFNNTQAATRRKRRSRPTRSMSGVPGVYEVGRSGMYRAYWTENTRTRHVPGTFDTVAKADAARKAAMKEVADAAIADISVAAKHLRVNDLPKKTTRRGAAARGGGATVEVWDMCGAASERF